jgi:hypothetical protein
MRGEAWPQSVPLSVELARNGGQPSWSAHQTSLAKDADVMHSLFVSTASTTGVDDVIAIAVVPELTGRNG